LNAYNININEDFTLALHMLYAWSKPIFGEVYDNRPTSACTTYREHFQY